MLKKHFLGFLRWGLRLHGISHFIEVFSALSEGAYITASIAIQLLSYSLPVLQEMRKEGESGRQKMNQYTRYLTFFLSLIQGFGITQFLISNNMTVVGATEFYFLGNIVSPQKIINIIYIIPILKPPHYIFYFVFFGRKRKVL